MKLLGGVSIGGSIGVSVVRAELRPSDILRHVSENFMNIFKGKSLEKVTFCIVYQKTL